jgi:hypothetical protein
LNAYNLIVTMFHAQYYAHNHDGKNSIFLLIIYCPLESHIEVLMATQKVMVPIVSTFEVPDRLTFVYFTQKLLILLPQHSLRQHITGFTL